MTTQQNKYFYDSDDPANHLFQYLTDATTGLVKNAVGDYSVTAEDFQVVAGASPLVIETMVVQIAGPKNAIAAALTNGITLEVTDAADVQLIDLTDGVPIVTNAGWAKIAAEVDREDLLGNNDNVVTVRLDFSKSGRPLILLPGQKFKVNLNDDFSALDNHTFFVKGFTGTSGVTSGAQGVYG